MDMSNTSHTFTMDKYIQAARRALANALPLLQDEGRQKLKRPVQISEKAPRDYQTDLDIRIEQRLVQTLRQAFPDHGIMAEEQAAHEGRGGMTWYIDPVDGTRNLLCGRPEIAISLALYEENRPLLAVIFLPARRLEILGHEGSRGLFVNAQPFTPPQPPPALDRALVGIPGDIRPGFTAADFFSLTRRIVPFVEGVRISGALAYDLAGMALGELAARISFSAKPVDVAAGVYLLKKVGGVVTDIRGNPYQITSKSILAAASPHLHEALLALLDGEAEQS